MEDSARAHAIAVANSAMWAAFGDALGFITELADSVAAVQRRLGSAEVTKLTSWRRQVGGQFGAEVELPSGCYSDDTQLRLSTSRAIREDGSFDVDAFAKIELPVWLSYALGGGVGTKEAARHLISRKVGWSSNFFATKRSHYFQAGGNGAAMRIQPHVWAAAPGLSHNVWLADVVRNAVCTHGHPRGIAGAALHGAILRLTLETGSVPSPSDWHEPVAIVRKVADALRADDVLRLVWLPTWEQAQGGSLEECFDAVAIECESDIQALREWRPSSAREYEEAVRAIGGLDRATRGSGTKTAILAMALAWWASQQEPGEVLASAANVLASDTDTIATMAGALLGARLRDELRMPPGKPMDSEYIHSEAVRMARVSQGRLAAKAFVYPDLLHWIAPKNQSDVLGMWDDKPGLAGLGTVRLDGAPIVGVGSRASRWQWAVLDFGQRLLVKRRAKLPELDDRLKPRARSAGSDLKRDRPKRPDDTGDGPSPTGSSFQRETVPVRAAIQESPLPTGSQRRLFEGTSESERAGPRRLSVDAAFDIARERGFAPSTVGGLLLQLADQEGGTDLAVAFAGLVARARSRMGRGTRG